MMLALREMRRRPGRFVVAGAILTLIALLLMFLGGLLDGLLGSSTGAYRAQDADLIVYSSSARESLPRSRVEPDGREQVEQVDGVEAVGGLGSTQLGARPEDHGSLDVAQRRKVETLPHHVADAGLDVQFVAGDATAFAAGSPDVPEVVVVNPPRRGIGPALARWLEASGVRRVLYSSCHAESLAGDLAAMPSLRPVRARLLDMFPQTAHDEVLVELRRAGPTPPVGHTFAS